MSRQENPSNSQDEVEFWDDHRHVLSFLLGIVTALLFYVSFLVILPFSKAIIWALALSVAIYPLHIRISQRIKKSNLAAGITVFIVGIGLLAPVIFVSIEIGTQANQALEKMQSPEFQETIERLAKKSPFLSSLASAFDIKGEIKKLAPGIAARLPVFAVGSVWKITEGLITLFILFYFLRDQSLFLNKTRQLLPLSAKEYNLIFTRVHDTITATMYGHLLMALIQGGLGGLVFWGLGLPAPLLWGAVMAVLAVLPILGAAFVWIPAAIFLIIEGAWGKALILVLFGSVVIGLIDNLLYPMLVGIRIHEHTLLVFLAIVGGVVFMGAAGIVAGPLLLAVTDALIGIWRERIRNRET